MNDTTKWVLICERSTLTAQKTVNQFTKKEDYILEGPCAVYGILNRNDRKYSRDVYYPHILEMQKRIDTETVWGELDHPESFDVSMKNVSHYVMKIWENEQGIPYIRIKLLNTRGGMDMKAIVDEGLPIYISSRAAGTVSENKNVELKKIFTYDIVATPGFREASLRSSYTNESYSELGEKKNVLTESMLLNAELGIESNSINIYDISECESFMKSKTFQPVLESHNNSIVFEKKHHKDDDNEDEEVDLNIDANDDTNKKTETKEDSSSSKKATKNKSKNMDKTTEISDISNEDLRNIIREQVAEMVSEQLSEIQEKYEHKLKVYEHKIKNLNNFCKNLELYSEHIVESVNDLEQDTTTNSNDMTLKHVIRYVNYLSENMNGIISYAEFIAESNNTHEEYMTYLAEMADFGIQYSESVAENSNLSFDKIVGYSNYIAEHVDNGIQYSEDVAETTSTNLESAISYMNYVAEKANNGIVYTERVAEYTDATIQFADNIAQAINESGGIINDGTTKNVEKNEKYKKIGLTENKGPIYKSRVDEKIENVLVTARKEKADKLEEDFKKHHFLRFLSPQNIATYNALDESKKQKIIESMVGATYFNEGDVLNIWKQALIYNPSDMDYLKMIPENVKAKWDLLSEAEQNFVKRQASNYKLENAYSINHFWYTRNFMNDTKSSYLKEDLSTKQDDKSTMNTNASYSVDYINFISEATKNS